MTILSRNKIVLNDGKIKHFETNETYGDLNETTELNCWLRFTLPNFWYKVQKI